MREILVALGHRLISTRRFRSAALVLEAALTWNPAGEILETIALCQLAIGEHASVRQIVARHPSAAWTENLRGAVDSISRVITEATAQAHSGDVARAISGVSSFRQELDTLPLGLLHLVLLRLQGADVESHSLARQLVAEYPEEPEAQKATRVVHPPTPVVPVGSIPPAHRNRAALSMALAAGIFLMVSAGFAVSLGKRDPSGSGATPTPPVGRTSEVPSSRLAALLLSPDQDSLRVAETLLAPALADGGSAVLTALRSRRTLQGREDYLRSRRRLSASDTLTALLLLEKVAGAPSEAYYTDDALYQLMLLYDSRSQNEQAARIANAIVTSHSESPFSNSITRRILREISQ